MPELVRSMAACVLLAMSCQAAGAQSSVADPARTYTLRTSARSVITDVLVLDRHGKPVHGLSASAFHLSDEGQPQPLTSFEEHSDLPQLTLAEDALGTGMYTNAHRLQMPPVVNIMVLDVANLSLPDQMYLSNQLERCIDHLPAGMPLAIYLDTGVHPVLVEDFTANHERLRDAVHHALPHFAALGRERFTDIATLRSIAAGFAEIPGRKNVLWFSGGSALSLNPTGMIATPSAELRVVYDELEAARVAVYPIDARGLLVGSNLPDPRQDAEATAETPHPTSDLTTAQHGLMQDVATATGGLPFYNNNGVWQGALQDMEAGSSFYTLSYTPKNLKFDNRWHRVRVTVDGNYTLNYRRGYFADGSNVTIPAGGRNRLLAGNKTESVEQPSLLVFSAEVKPMAAASLRAGERPPAPGQTRYRIDFLIPGKALGVKQQGAEADAVVGVGYVAVNRDGELLLQHAEQITFTVNQDKLKQNPDAMLPISKQLDLNRGDTYLTLVVWDELQRKVGTLSVPLQVPQDR